MLILNVFVISVKAQLEGTGLPSDLQSDVEKIQNLTEKGQEIVEKTKEQESREYLFQEWKKTIENNKYFSPIILGYKKISPVVNPVSKYAIGLEPSLTWIFILTLILWIVFVIYSLRILELTALSSRWVQYVVSIGIVVIISVAGITKKIAEYVIKVISLAGTWWVQLILIGIVILALIFASFFSKNLQEIFCKKESIEETYLFPRSIFFHS